MLMKLRHALLNLNIFSNRNSEASVVRKQILSTRLYIASLLSFTLILVTAIEFNPRIRTNTVVMPTRAQFETLFQSGKLPQSCPCSQIAIPRSKFISLTPIFHQVCSSQLVTEDWIDRASYSDPTQPSYHYLDFRSYGIDSFRALMSLCSIANTTSDNAIKSLLTTDWISTQVLPYEQFDDEVQTIIIDFQSSLKNIFKQVFQLARQITHGNQLLSGTVSNFNFDGMFDSSGHLTSVRTYMGTELSTNNTSMLCSCLLNTCNQQLGFFNASANEDIAALIVNIPGMRSACYPSDALRISTLECWFNESCIALVLAHLTPFLVEAQLDALNTSMLIRFSPTTTVGDIIDELMIEEWINQTDYDAYYNSCKPVSCVYISYERFNWLYTFTILTAVFGGLCVFLRVICPFLITLWLSYRRNRHIPITGKHLTCCILHFFT